MDINDIPITIKSHARAKRLTLSSRNGRIVVTKPKHLPVRAAQMFALKHRPWIEKHYQPPFKLADNSVLGEITIRLASDIKPAFEWEGSTIRLRSNHQINNDQLVKNLKQGLRVRARDRLYLAIDKWTEKMNLEPNRLRIADTYSRWGSCSSNGTLSFSIYAAQLPEELIDYLVVHELAHLKHPNHSPKFWREVESFWPQAKKSRLKLKQYRLGIG